MKESGASGDWRRGQVPDVGFTVAAALGKPACQNPSPGRPSDGRHEREGARRKLNFGYRLWPRNGDHILVHFFGPPGTHLLSPRRIVWCPEWGVVRSEKWYHQVVLALGPEFVPEIHIQCSASEAFAAWQWWTYCCSQVPDGKVALRINMDEASVCLFQGDSKRTALTKG